MRSLGPVLGPLDVAAARRFVSDYEQGRRSGDRMAWILRDPSSGTIVGGIVLLRTGPAEAELGYWLAPASRGRGLATHGLALAADAALGCLGLHRVWLAISPDDPASRCVAERDGFRTAAPLPKRANVEPDSDVRSPRIIICERVRRDPLPGGFRIRAPQPAEVDAVAALIEACEIGDTGEATVDARELDGEWRSLPGFDLERDAWVLTRSCSPVDAWTGDHGADTTRGPAPPPASAALPGGGDPVAFAWLRDEEEHRVLVGDFSVHPRLRGRGLEEVLMDRIEARAREHAALTAECAATLDVFALESAPDKTAPFVARGYCKVREFVRMRIDLEAGLKEPAWPPGVTVRPFRPGTDDAAVREAMQEAFVEHFRATRLSLEDWRAFLSGNPRFDPALWSVSWAGERVVGACLSFFYPDRRTGYVDELGVLRAWRGRGLGTALLLRAFADLRALFALSAILCVDTRNATGALRVYEAAGMRRQWQTDVYTERVPVPLCASASGTSAPSSPAASVSGGSSDTPPT